MEVPPLAITKLPFYPFPAEMKAHLRKIKTMTFAPSVAIAPQSGGEIDFSGIFLPPAFTFQSHPLIVSLGMGLRLLFRTLPWVFGIWSL